MGVALGGPWTNVLHGPPRFKLSSGFKWEIVPSHSTESAWGRYVHIHHTHSHIWPHSWEHAYTFHTHTLIHTTYRLPHKEDKMNLTNNFPSRLDTLHLKLKNSGASVVLRHRRTLHPSPPAWVCRVPNKLRTGRVHYFPLLTDRLPKSWGSQVAGQRKFSTGQVGMYILIFRLQNLYCAFVIS